MAKQLYDYWFVQFDFPNEEGKPYKSSGGKMVWNKKIKREIPEDWKEVTLNAFIDKNKAGDWGYDTPKDRTIKVGCVRGADIIKLNDVPTRYITLKHSDRLLEDGDIVIEISGGSPVQVTGRVALITNGVIGRNGGALVCSNFCQSFNMKKREFSEYFYYLWQNLYDNGNMFNFEGKTSGIKNFQTDVFLANHWFEVPKQLIETFHTIVAQYHLMIDQNIIENNNLIKQRDELLPLLINGQVSVNSDLAKCISEIGIVAIIRNYPNSLLKYWRLVIIYKCRITFSYNFSSHSASLPLLSQTSNTSSDKLLPLHPVFGHPKVNQKLSPRHRMKSVQVDRQ